MFGKLELRHCAGALFWDASGVFPGCVDACACFGASREVVMATGLAHLYPNETFQSVCGRELKPLKMANKSSCCALCSVSVLGFGVDMCNIHGNAPETSSRSVSDTFRGRMCEHLCVTVTAPETRIRAFFSYCDPVRASRMV